MKQHTFRESAPVWAAFLPIVLWLGALASTAYQEGMNLFSWMESSPKPWSIPSGWRGGPTLRHSCWGRQLSTPVGFSFTTPPGRTAALGRSRAPPGGAASAALDKKYRDRDPEENVILSQHLRMSLDGKKHRRNLLQIVVGGSGSGKTRFLVKPNIFLANAKLHRHRPQGEILRAAGPCSYSGGTPAGVRPGGPQPFRLLQPLSLHPQGRRRVPAHRQPHQEHHP